MKDNVFISYSPKGGEFVNRIVSDLSQTELHVSYDLTIGEGESWVEMLTRAIESARYFLVVMSPEYFGSPWAQQCG